MNIFYENSGQSQIADYLGVIVSLFVAVGFSKFTAYEGNPELLAIFG